MSQPRISRLRTWEKHERRVVDILLLALSILRNNDILPQSEVLLNRKLYFCLLEANKKMKNSGCEYFDHIPTPEGHNPPDPDDELLAVRENKIPDFYWGYIDHSELDPRRGARNYVIECKRLGSPLRTDWILNQNYVHNGILRFITEEHGYAKGERSGAMVGYVQSMEFDEILREVNATAALAGIPGLKAPNNGWQINGSSQLAHQLNRLFEYSPFQLSHIWADLRNSSSKKKQPL
jgi:hypothetical protein